MQGLAKMGAGALGLAISFGSQTLVKDIITGVFIQFENGMSDSTDTDKNSIPPSVQSDPE